jgi:6-phosphogluconolactonase/glucosamine-6-phosphate isomerase/deaminase
LAAPVACSTTVRAVTTRNGVSVSRATFGSTATGAAKAPVLARALKGPEDLVACPAQWLRRASGRVVIVADEAAAALL